MDKPSDNTLADRARGRLMARALGQLLNRAPGAREVLLHLAALERSLLTKGCAVIHTVPAHGIKKIASQLASLPLPADDAPLQDLLQRVLAAVQEQESEWGAGQAGFNYERTMVIREISHSEFAAAADEQATTMPLQLS
jgi:hypothetical protein